MLARINGTEEQIQRLILNDGSIVVDKEYNDAFECCAENDDLDEKCFIRGKSHHTSLISHSANDSQSRHFISHLTYQDLKKGGFLSHSAGDKSYFFRYKFKFDSTVRLELSDDTILAKFHGTESSILKERLPSLIVARTFDTEKDFILSLYDRAEKEIMVSLTSWLIVII